MLWFGGCNLLCGVVIGFDGQSSSRRLAWGGTCNMECLPGLWMMRSDRMVCFGMSDRPLGVAAWPNVVYAARPC